METPSLPEGMCGSLEIRHANSSNEQGVTSMDAAPGAAGAPGKSARPAEGRTAAPARDALRAALHGSSSGVCMCGGVC